MVGSFDFYAELRTETGKGNARRARRQGKVLGIVYGAGSEPTQLYLEHHKVSKALENSAVYSHVLNLHIEGNTESVILKALGRHPSKPIIMHMDFLRVSDAAKLRVHVPLKFVNEATSVGVKKGGVVNHNVVEVEITCLPAYLPEFIEVDMAGVELGQSLHLSDLKLPVGVELVELSHGVEHDLAVVGIHAARSTDSAES